MTKLLKSKTLMSAAAVAGALAFSSAASAVPVITWDYDISAAWGLAEFTAGGGTQTNDGAELSWGATGGSHAVPNGDRSALVITNSPAFGDIDTNVDIEDANSFTHFNNSISTSFATLESALLSINVALTPNNPAGPALPVEMFQFDILFTETVNKADGQVCADGSIAGVSGPGCQDIFVVLGDASGYDFSYDGQLYQVNFFTVDGAFAELSDDACAAADAASGCRGFLTQEEAATTVDFQFNIINRGEIEVPAPGALGILGLGLLGLGAARLRRR